MINVVQLVVSTGLGGGPRHVYDLVLRLAADEFASRVVGPADGPYCDRFRAAGIAVEPLRVHRLSPMVLARVVQTIRRQQIDVIHSHGKGAGLYGRLAGRLTGRSSIHTFHGIHLERYGRVAEKLYTALERKLGDWSAAVITLSSEQRQEVIDLGFAPAGRCVAIPNGIDMAELDAAAGAPYPRSAYGARAGDLVVGCIARFDPVKQLEVLIDATARLCPRFPNLRLVLVGSGPRKRSLRHRAARLGIAQRVSFPGALPDAVRCYPGWDVYATMSVREGLPYALLEAMASGLPVVASDVPGHREIIRNGVTGMLVSAEPPAVAEVMARVLQDDGLRRALGPAARRVIELDFTVDQMVQRISEVYRRAVEPDRREKAMARLHPSQSIVR